MQTGDIPAIWLRDSAAQTLPYVRLATVRPMLRTWIRAVVLREARNIVMDPYANAFRSNYRIWERKWENDSLAYPAGLSWTYYNATHDGAIFTASLHGASQRVVDTYACERVHARCSRYRPPTRSGGADRGPAPEVGLIWSAFRASDDPTRYAYNIPEQMFAATALRDVADLASHGYEDAALAERAARFATALSQAIARHGVVDQPARRGGVRIRSRRTRSRRRVRRRESPESARRPVERPAIRRRSDVPTNACVHTLGEEPLLFQGPGRVGDRKSAYAARVRLAARVDGARAHVRRPRRSAA